MREYELVYILTPEVAEDAVPEAMERVNRVIAGRGADVMQSERWGRRRLAYPIKRFLEGTSPPLPPKTYAFPFSHGPYSGARIER